MSAHVSASWTIDNCIVCLPSCGTGDTTDIQRQIRKHVRNHFYAEISRLKTSSCGGCGSMMRGVLSQPER